MIRHTPFLCLPLLLLAACGPASVSGRVDGEGVGGASDAFYDEIRIDFGPFGELEYLVVMVSDFAPGCDIFEDFFTTIEPTCDDLCDEYIGYAEEYHLGRDDYWSLAFVVNVSDGIDDVFDFDEDLGDSEFTASFSSWDTRPLHDPAECEDACEDRDLLEAEVDEGKDGELELADEGDRIRGRFDLQLGGDDALKGSFSAHACDMEEWIWFN